MSVGLALALLAAPAVTPVATVTAIHTVELTPQILREMRRRDAKLARLCRSALHHRDALGRLEADADTLSRIAERLWRGEGGCRKNPALAIDVLRFAVGKDALRFDANIVSQLDAYLTGHGDPGDRAELAELEAILWVRGDHYSGTISPAWTAETKRAFIARDDIWAFLSAPDTHKSWNGQQARLEALLDPLSPRYAPAAGVAALEAGPHAEQWVRAARLLLLGGDGLPRDTPRAEALLAKAAPYADEARLLLEPLLARQMKSPDAAVRAAALQQYEPWSRLDGPGAAAMRAVLIPHYRSQLAAPVRDDQGRAVQALTRYTVAYPGTDPAALLRWIDTALRKGDDNDKALGWRSLGALAGAKAPGAERVMNDAFARAGGLVDGGTLKAVDLKRIVTNDDYPARAVREEREGVVESDAIIAPDGRALMVIITASPEKALGEEVQKLVMRRLRAKDLLAAPGRYVRAKLPPIQFRLRPCEGEMTPAVEGALLIDGWCIAQPNLDVPIS